MTTKESATDVALFFLRHALRRGRGSEPFLLFWSAARDSGALKGTRGEVMIALWQQRYRALALDKPSGARITGLRVHLKELLDEIDSTTCGEHLKKLRADRDAGREIDEAEVEELAIAQRLLERDVDPCFSCSASLAHPRLLRCTDPRNLVDGSMAASDPDCPCSHAATSVPASVPAYETSSSSASSSSSLSSSFAPLNKDASSLCYDDFGL